jgi:hypothetical protein
MQPNSQSSRNNITKGVNTVILRQNNRMNLERIIDIDSDMIKDYITAEEKKNKSSNPALIKMLQRKIHEDITYILYLCILKASGADEIEVSTDDNVSNLIKTLEQHTPILTEDLYDNATKLDKWAHNKKEVSLTEISKGYTVCRSLYSEYKHNIKSQEELLLNIDEILKLCRTTTVIIPRDIRNKIKKQEQLTNAEKMQIYKRLVKYFDLSLPLVKDLNRLVREILMENDVDMYLNDKSPVKRFNVRSKGQHLKNANEKQQDTHHTSTDIGNIFLNIKDFIPSFNPNLSKPAQIY